MSYYLILLSLFFTSIIAGTIDTIAGGGGLITVPALLLTGISPAQALGTNRFQSAFGEFNAARVYVKNKKLLLSTILYGFIFIILGAMLGTILVQIINPNQLNKIIPILLLIVLLYMIFVPKPKNENKKPVMSRKLFYSTIGFSIGFYNGFFGPGTGSLLIFALMFFQGLNIVEANMRAKPLNFIGNLTSLICFIIGGNIQYPMAMVMAMGQLIGSKIGAHLVMNKGHEVIKPIFIIVMSVMTVEMLVKTHMLA